MPDSAQERKTESRDWRVDRKAEDSGSCNLLQIGLLRLNRGADENGSSQLYCGIHG